MRPNSGETNLYSILFAISFLIVCVVSVVYGYFHNIFELVETKDVSNHIGMIIVRTVGIFLTPIGTIMGLFF